VGKFGISENMKLCMNMQLCLRMSASTAIHNGLLSHAFIAWLHSEASKLLRKVMDLNFRI
jgi:hypothetical protein